jgi:CHASE1-domain containing sensor protein
MARRLFSRSFYVRTIVQLTLAILVVFLVLSLVYYAIVSRNSMRQQANKLLNAAQAISSAIAINLNSEATSKTRR